MKQISLGWSPDVSDFRDHTISTSNSREHPTSLDLREMEMDLEPPAASNWNASCSVSILSLLDWQSRKWRGERTPGSADFLHQLTAQTAGGGGETGISIRSALKTLKRYGAPPRRLCHQLGNLESYQSRPELFGFANEYCGLQYLRLDSWNRDFPQRIEAMKEWLVKGNPFLMGFAVPHHFTRCKNYVPFDVSRGGTLGGTVGIILGYDDNYPLYEQLDKRSHRTENHGAFLIKTFWENDWESKDCHWLPYTFIKHRFAADAWALSMPDS